MNSELPNKSLARKRILIWVIFYLALSLIIGSVFVWAHNDIKERNLPPGHIALEMQKKQFNLGDPVTFTLINHFPTTIYVPNRCPSEPLEVYKWQNEKWVHIHDKADQKACSGQPRQVSIAASQSVTYSFADWPSLFKEAGYYRLVAVVDNYPGLPYQDFQVVDPNNPSTTNSVPSSQAPVLDESTVPDINLDRHELDEPRDFEREDD